MGIAERVDFSKGTRFALGQTMITRGVLKLAQSGILNPTPYLERHARGDWGDLDDKDKAENQRSLGCRLRLVSAYLTPAGKIYIITEADRSLTTILLPDEY